ncbi:MAG: TOBE domain-containing protein, partial [Acetobacteraceae bacterium]|nr:TOBE domain-containing protein [Acetobacteraceae bacterium]
VTLGIRPEDLLVAPDGPLAGEVVSVEPLGAETILALRLPGLAADLLLRAGRDAPARLGERLALRADAASLHLFDAATGARLDGPERR